MGLSPAYCNSCRSHSCLHALQINEHNMRMQYDRMSIGMGGMPISVQPEMVMRIEDGSSVSVASDNQKNKKLLLLGRR